MRRADKFNAFLCRLSSKPWIPNLLEPSGPVQACNGIALPLPLCLCYEIALLKKGPRFFFNLTNQLCNWMLVKWVGHGTGPRVERDVIIQASRKEPILKRYPQTVKVM